MALVLDGEGRTQSVSSSPYVSLRETMTLLQRQFEDLAWTSVSTDPDQNIEEPYGDRVNTIKAARLAVRRSPLAKVAVGLLQHYTLGQGVSVKAQNRKLVAKLVDEMMETPANKAVWSSHQSQKEFLEALYTDGDYFFVLFPDFENGTIEVGTIDATLVEDPIPDEQNAKLIRWFKVRKPKKTYDYEQGRWDSSAADDFVYYRHYENEDPADGQHTDNPGLPVPPKMGSKLQKGLIFQVSVDRRGKFGRSQLAAALDWLRAHKEFMEDRATINRAAAAVAWKKKRKGPASDVAAEAEKLRSSLVSNVNRYERNPPPASGATVVENEGSSLEWVKTDTGGGAADYDERKLRMMVGSALGGVPNHYFGDEAAANLATATAMELPLLKMYEDYQKVVSETLDTILTYGLKVAHEAGRIGENDRESRYMERDTTKTAVMDQPPPLPAPEPAPVSATEAGFPPAVPGAPKMPYQPPPMGGIRMLPKPEDMATDDPGQEDSPTKPVSWYIDIDFPPIIQKDIQEYMTALNTFAAMLPDATIESKKLIVELGLTVFGVNDIDKEMERLFPPDMVAVLVPPPPEPAPPVTAPGQPGPNPPKAAAPKVPVQSKEDLREAAPVSIAHQRRMRLLRVADEAAEALAEEAI